jgi:hypothetical protein
VADPGHPAAALGVAAAVPSGHGLGCTTFDYGPLELESDLHRHGQTRRINGDERAFLSTATVGS